MLLHKKPGFLFLFLSEGLNSPFLENEYRGKERHVDTTTPTGRPNITGDNVIPLIFITLPQSAINRLKPTVCREKAEVETADQSYFHRHSSKLNGYKASVNYSPIVENSLLI